MKVFLSLSCISSSQLELEEYGSDTEEEYDGDMIEENECHESLAEKLNHAFKERAIDGLERNNYGPDDAELLEPEADVINRCREYAEKYENEGPAEETAIFDESSSDSEVWDCETIVSTYSNLDNHPGKIVAPEARRKKLLPAISEASPIISLKGKANLPVDYLPSKGKHALLKEDKKKQGSEKEGKDNPMKEQLKRKQHGQESKEEKKERKVNGFVYQYFLLWNCIARYLSSAELIFTLPSPFGFTFSSQSYIKHLI